MTRELLLILIVAFSLFVIWRFFASLIMLRFAIRSGNAHGKHFRYFIMCFLLGLPAYLYVISLPDWKVRFYLHKILWLLERNPLEKQSPVNSPLRFSNWSPEAPKKGVSVEAFLEETVPDDASVAASTYLLPHLADRDEIYEVHYHKNKPDIEYVVLDARYTSHEKFYEEYLEHGYTVVAELENCILVLKQPVK